QGSFAHLLAFDVSPDGRLLATNVGDAGDTRVPSETKLWDVATGRELGPLAGYQGLINDVAFAPDGQTLAAGCADRCLRLWDVKTRRVRFTFPPQTGRIGSLAFSPDGKTLLSEITDPSARDPKPGMVKVWEADTGRELDAIPFPPGVRVQLAV